MKILSIDGGGTRGIIPATVLTRLSEQTGQEPREWADLIAGSATGGVLAIALGCGLAPGRIAELYRDESAKIFSRTFMDKVRSWGILKGPRYNADHLYEVLVKYFGNTRTLGDIHDSTGGRTTFLIPALDLSPMDQNGQPENLKPIVFDSSNPAHQSLKAVDVAMRTAAAPMFFRIREQYVEGGTVANNPASLALTWALSRAIHQGLDLEVWLRNLRLLSLGCGTTGDARADQNAIGDGNWGLLKWKDYLQHLVIETNMSMTMWQIETLIPNNHLRINHSFKAPNTPDALRNKKLRLDIKDPAQLAALAEVGEELFARHQKALIELVGSGARASLQAQA